MLRNRHDFFMTVTNKKNAGISPAFLMFNYLMLEAFSTFLTLC